MPRSNAASPRKVLLTGHQGFTGRYVAEALQARGHEVLCLGADPADLASPSVDLRDPAAVTDTVARAAPDAVIHLGAITFVAHGDADDMYRTNVVGTRHLLQALAALGRTPSAVLLASSANVYGNSDHIRLDESVPPRPANDYAVSKLAMEYMARLWMDRLPITLLRPFNYTGVGQGRQFLLPKIVDHFRRGERRIELGNIEVARDFQDVRFVADVYARLLNVAPAGDVLNVCSGTAMTLTEVIHLMEHIAGHAIEVRVNPAFVRPNEVSRLEGDNSRLAAIVGPLAPIPLEDTLRWMYAQPAEQP
jgi:nucleoside-diphosphate-sugar epimerase